MSELGSADAPPPPPPPDPPDTGRSIEDSGDDAPDAEAAEEYDPMGDLEPAERDQTDSETDQAWESADADPQRADAAYDPVSEVDAGPDTQAEEAEGERPDAEPEPAEPPEPADPTDSADPYELQEPVAQPETVEGTEPTDDARPAGSGEADVVAADQPEPAGPAETAEQPAEPAAERAAEPPERSDPAGEANDDAAADLAGAVDPIDTDLTEGDGAERAVDDAAVAEDGPPNPSDADGASVDDRVDHADPVAHDAAERPIEETDGRPTEADPVEEYDPIGDLAQDGPATVDVDPRPEGVDAEPAPLTEAPPEPGDEPVPVLDDVGRQATDAAAADPSTADRAELQPVVDGQGVAPEQGDPDTATESATPRADAMRANRPDRFTEASWDRICDGVAFNEEREPYYSDQGGGNEIILESGKRLDSYMPDEEIISRKFTQLADVQPETALEYVREIDRKYSPGEIIADTPHNREELPDYIGEEIAGRPILEVPVQNAPVPEAVLTEAERLGIIVRDISGKIYGPSQD